MLKLYFLFYKTLKKELKCGVRLETFIVVKKKKDYYLRLYSYLEYFYSEISNNPSEHRYRYCARAR